MNETSRSLTLTVARQIDDAIAALVPTTIPGVSPIVVAQANDLSRELAVAIGSRFGDAPVEIVAPRGLRSLTWQRLRQRTEPSRSIDLRQTEGRLSSVRLQRELVDAAMLIAVNDLRGESGDRPTIAIGMWGRFTDVRDRLGYRLSAADKGAAAEIALGAKPHLIVIVDRWKTSLIAVATDDQIVAELAGLAIRQLKEGDFAEPAGPWEDPLVQHATDLGLGVRLPSQIVIRARVGSRPTSAGMESVTLLADALALKLGVTNLLVE